MSRLALLSFAMVLLVGCAGRTFTDLGNGVAVPSRSISDYAEANGLTHVEARARMRAESDRRRIAEHAEKYGVSTAEAKEQIEHAAS